MSKLFLDCKLRPAKRRVTASIYIRVTKISTNLSTDHLIISYSEDNFRFPVTN